MGVIMNTRAHGRGSLLFLAGMLLFGASACSQPYTLAVRSPIQAELAPPPVILSAHEEFTLSAPRQKKIDFLFVVDNSGSMKDNQAALAEGFRKFASTFFYRRDLNVCVAITTSDRYTGRTGSDEYARDRSVPCTNPESWEGMTDEQVGAATDAILEEFVQKVQVGVDGASKELLGKAVVTWLRDADKYTDSPTGTRNPFFRGDAVSNISFVTDENNYFFKPDVTEELNDLPAFTGSVAGGRGADQRKGLREHLDEYFLGLTGARSASALNYSVTSMLELSRSRDQSPGLSVNLLELVTAVGRDSVKGDIKGTADEFAALYSKVGERLLIRARSVKLAHEWYGAASLVTLERIDGSGLTILAQGTDFTLVEPNQLVLSEVLQATIRDGDKLAVDYRYIEGK